MDRLPQIYALLIGIDHYTPNTQQYASLKGCVYDAICMENLLQSKLDFPKEHIIKLISPAAPATVPTQQLPTYSTIVSAFQRLLKMAESGDFIYIYFSGHGARATSLLADKKVDEVLVPMDIGTPQGRYLHDVELAYLLREMEDAGLIVTIILDSCFAGGTTRGAGEIRVRGSGTIDQQPRPGESQVASLQRLSQTWRRLPKGIRRSFCGLPEPRTYVLLAACGATEQAVEYHPSGEYSGYGMFTYWLLDTLQRIGPNTTYGMLHARLKAQVHSELAHQTPFLLGEADRLVFSEARLRVEPAITVLRVDLERQELLLNAGEVQGVGKGAKLAVYAAGVTDFSQPDQCQALVEICHPGGTSSLARIVETFNAEPLEAGALAILRDPGKVRLQRLIRLVPCDDLPSTIPQQTALVAVGQCIQLLSHRFVRLAEQQEMVDYQIAINAAECYEVWDCTGVLIDHLSPALSIHEKDAAQKLVHRLIHITKYNNIQQLENKDKNSPLAGKLLVTLLGKQASYDPDEQPEPEPFTKTDGNPLLKPEEWMFVHIKNTSKRDLNITAFNLAPDWSITQVFPYDAPYHTLVPGEDYLLDLKAELPGNMTAVTDILKVFATIGSTDFQWLQLPPLDHFIHHRGKRGRPSLPTPLEDLLFALMEDAPGTRNLTPNVRPAHEWITSQIQVDIQ